MKFRTEISDLLYPFHIQHGEKVLLLGSCFSDNIGQKLEYFGFDALYNPFGVVYNPISIAMQIGRIIDQKAPDADEYLLKNQLWHHFDFHSSNSGIDLESVKSKNTHLIETACEFISQAKFLFITPGTSIVYKTRTGNKIVANNHKYPSDYFYKKSLKSDEIVQTLKNIFSNILDFNPELKIVLNISPVRHIRDGLIENQRSKAELITAIAELTEDKQVFYFPSYEIVMDDLRDYRYYAADLVHPSSQAIDYIWEKFSEAFFGQKTKAINQKLDKINKALLHRPLFPETLSYKKFKQELDSEIQQFKHDHPEVKVLS